MPLGSAFQRPLRSCIGDGGGGKNLGGGYGSLKFFVPLVPDVLAMPLSKPIIGEQSKFYNVFRHNMPCLDLQQCSVLSDSVF